MPPKSQGERRKRVRLIVNRLRRAYPERGTALEHQSALQLLVATILSAQCTDARVNKVTPSLFARYRKASDYADADREELEALVRTTGFYRNKARSIQGACRKIADEFDGQVPQTMDELTSLPGVARKTANVVLGNYYGKATGVVVDTHVFRLSHRLGLTASKNPAEVENDLMAVAAEKDWIDLGNLLIRHGRSVCTARNPKCEECVVESHCPKIGVLKGGAKGKAPASAKRVTGKGKKRKRAGRK